MGNMHILEATAGRYRIAMHIPTPSGNNSSGVPWSSALINSKRGGTTVLTTGDGTGGSISAAELASIQAGTLYEVMYGFTPDAAFEALTSAQQKTVLDQALADITSNAIAELSVTLKRYGLVVA